jgi:two-component system cell cycle sensor histidine kinase/response regulator CckA
MTAEPPGSHPQAPDAPGAHEVLDASPNAIVAVDAAGLVTYANPSVRTTFGWPPSELVGRPVEVLIPAILAERHGGHRARFSHRASARPMGIGLDLAGRRRDGSTFPVEISLAPVDTPDGRLVYATVVDITARKALVDQLLQAQKMESIGRLAGGIAHDFNNMLFAIRGYVDILLEDLVTAGESVPTRAIRPSIEAIGGAADRASVLTAQLLSFSRRQVVHPVIADLRDAIAAIEPMLRRIIGEQVRLALDLDPATGEVRVDPGQLDQILMNLAVNARDAMPGGGTITIETSNATFDEAYAMEQIDVSPGSYVMLAVSDTGTGMDRETRRHIFEPFFTTKEAGKGTGLGLSTIYGIMRQAGGHVWLYSEPGRGTTFKLYFPRVDSPALESRPTRDPSAEPAGLILLVEDDPIVRELSRRMLDRGGYVVVAANDSREALSRLESGADFDALVTDVVMPDLSGAELARRALEIRPGLPIVLLSGYSAETAEIEALVRRGARFASKPLAGRDLLLMLGEAVGKRRTRN